MASAIGEGDIFELNVVGTIVGVVAAVLLIALAEGFGVGQDRTGRVFRARPTSTKSSSTGPLRTI